MRRYLKYILPTPAMWVGTLVLPTTLLIYFLATQYGDAFIETQGIDYVAVQDNIFATLFLSGQVGDFITRAMDFVFWGVLATIGLLVFWGASVARTSLENSSAISGFANKVNDNWHQKALVLVGVKVGTVVVVVYAALSLLTQSIPTLASGAAELIQSVSLTAILATAWGFALTLLIQLILIVNVRIFKLAKFE